MVEQIHLGRGGVSRQATGTRQTWLLASAEAWQRLQMALTGPRGFGSHPCHELLNAECRHVRLEVAPFQVCAIDGDAW